MYMVDLMPVTSFYITSKMHQGYSLLHRKPTPYITSRNNAPISNYGGVFKKIEKNKKKMTEKREFLRKTSFRPNRIFFMVVIQKLITENT
ncbi:Uncharacterized protein FWK35_00004286 [Aphis craccivora]|uniref:Uncharacterized protein n=1 Tax=Aphis craccivora TaxID=307492 RepID=A0A6G0Z960_APHCR|nr:Uncharacterized protein FWK35_00004286 [Aphis craccivora]